MKKELSLVREAAWEFPAFQQASEETGQTLDRFLSTLSEDGFERAPGIRLRALLSTCGLFGTRAHCLAMVERLKEIGVDEIACLIDFGSLDMGMTERPNPAASSRAE